LKFLTVLSVLFLASFACGDDEGLPLPRQARSTRAQDGVAPATSREAPHIFLAVEKPPGQDVNDTTCWSVSLAMAPDGTAQLRVNHMDMLRRDGVFDGKLTEQEAAALQKGYDELAKLPEPVTNDTVIPRGGVVHTFGFPDAQGNMRHLRVNQDYMQRVFRQLKELERVTGVYYGASGDAGGLNGIAQRLDRGQVSESSQGIGGKLAGIGNDK
jgi:hypothetical protein